MSQCDRNKGPLPGPHAQPGQDGFRIIQTLRLRLAQLRTMEYPKAAALAAECETALVVIEQKLDAIARTGSRPALRF